MREVPFDEVRGLLEVRVNLEGFRIVGGDVQIARQLVLRVLEEGALSSRYNSPDSQP